ncbi:MAG TPA: hypothetical protein VGE52_03385 [Pirellulales bacterium]
MRLAGEILGYLCIAVVAIELSFLCYGLAIGSLDYQKLTRAASIAAGWDDQASESLAAAVERPLREETRAQGVPVAAERPTTDEPARR